MRPYISAHVHGFCYGFLFVNSVNHDLVVHSLVVRHMLLQGSGVVPLRLLSFLGNRMCSLRVRLHSPLQGGRRLRVEIWQISNPPPSTGLVRRPWLRSLFLRLFDSLPSFSPHSFSFSILACRRESSPVLTLTELGRIFTSITPAANNRHHKVGGCWVGGRPPLCSNG